jgi:AmiR/NasT family two-component response regulator
VQASEDDNPERPKELEALRREIESLRIALETRTVIANATGLLMGVGNVTAEEAFEQLRRASQRTNQKLRELAAVIIERHEEQVRASRTRPQTHRQQIKEG